MKNKIKKLYIVHHSHTDIGYTDLQEKVVYNQVDYIKTAVELFKAAAVNNTSDVNFRWNCETYYCVERFLAEATEEDKKAFFELVKKGNIGISATYLNFNDLVDCEILNRRTAEMVQEFKKEGIDVKTAMNADINGISMGARDAFINNGIEFLFTNIHTHHGMYPLFQNQNAYFWENNDGKRLLVFNGEHYNLGNALGIKPNVDVYYMAQSLFGKNEEESGPIKTLHDNLAHLVCEYEGSDYPYDFVVTSVSGVFSDNAPPNTEILRVVEQYNEKYGEADGISMEMVSLQELYAKVKPELLDVPVYKGDLNDWWANGIGSTPYAVKHYKEAQKNYRLCEALSGLTSGGDEGKALMRAAEDNLLIYAEHTWGHSSTITNPYDTMVTNLDIRKTAYASKAHEAAAINLAKISHGLGDAMRYYAASANVKAINPTSVARKAPVEFFVEIQPRNHVKVTEQAGGREITAQLSSHPRGILISFIDSFAPFEEKTYRYELSNQAPEPAFTRTAYVGAERVRDIVNDYDKETYTLPYGIENDFFKISYVIGSGVTSFYDKKAGKELLCDNSEFAGFFTPVYENTEIRNGVYGERSKLGRNIRGLHAKQYKAELFDVKILDCGKVFVTVKLLYKLEGTYQSSVIIKLYRDIPKIDFKYQVAKTLSEDIESLYMPLSLNAKDSELFIQKGGVSMRPGIDQIPGTGMEYYVADDGIVYQGKKGSAVIATLDTPLIYMGEMAHHPIRLCKNEPENNKRDVYSWIMNNTWETNFKMDLSGFDEFCYSIELSDKTDAKASFEVLKAATLGIYAFIIN